VADRHLAPRIDIGPGTLLLPLVAMIGLVTIWPLLRLGMELFVADPAPLDFILRTLAKKATLTAFLNTVDSAFWSSVLAVAIGLSAALVVGTTDLRFKAAASFLILLPLLIPSQITALAWKELFSLISPPGATNPLYSRNGVILVLGIENSTAVFLAVRAAMRAISWDLVEAARISGAGPARTILTVILPLISPGILAGFSLSFVAAIGNFGVPALLGIPGRFPVLSTLIYRRLNGFGPAVLGETVVLALPLILLSTFGLTLRSLASRRLSTGIHRGTSALVPFSLGKGRLAVELAAGAFFFALSVLPLVSLAISSLIPAVGVELNARSLTLDNYRFVLFEQTTVLRAFANSIRLSLVAALALGMAALPLAYLSTLRKNRTARFLDTLADIPYAIPGIVLSIAMILAFIKPLPVIGSLYNSFWILLVAYLARFFAPALRTTTSALEQFDIRLEEAAQVLGAGVFRRLRTVILPAAAASAVAGALLVFMAAVNELTVSSLLWSTGNETIGVVIYALQYEGNSPEASAVSMMSIGIVLLIAAVFGYFGKYLPDGVVPWRV